LLDQDVYRRPAKFLADSGHDVVAVAELGMSSASDQENLNKAKELGRVFVTRDRDFGHLVFVKGLQVGVIYLRILARDSPQVHVELARVLTDYSEADLKNSFVVVEAKGHRIRKID
jgi:predicted nuclease of predicted toxin-antitoxin system